MKLKAFRVGPHLISSQNLHLSSHFPLRFLSHYRTKAVENWNSHEKLKLDLRNIKCLDDGLSLYKDMRRMSPLPSVIQFTQLLSAVVKLGEYYAATCLFRDFCSFGIPIDKYTMTIAINTYCLSNRVDFGFSILGSFFKRGCVPNSFTFSTLLKGLFKENRGNDALELFTKIVGEGWCELDVFVYGTVIDGLCKSGGVTAAMGTVCKDDWVKLRRLLILWLTIVLFRTYGCFRRGRCSQARKLFDEMQAAGIKPVFHTYSILLDGLFDNGHSEEALALLDELEQKEDVHISYYGVVMNAFFKDNKLDRVRAVFSGLGSKGLEPNVVTYNILIKACCQDGVLEEAKDLALQMKEANVLPDGITYNCMVQACLRRDEYEDATSFVEEMVEKGFSPDADTLELVLSLPGTVENNPTLLRMAQILAPNTFR